MDPAGVEPNVFNWLENDSAPEGRGYAPPVTKGSSRTGSKLAVHELAPTLRANGAKDSNGKQGNRTDKQPTTVTGTVRSHMRPGSNASDDVIAEPDPDDELHWRLEAMGFLPPVPVDPGRPIAPDGPRYAAMGDAVTVNVIEWIGVRLRSKV